MSHLTDLDLLRRVPLFALLNEEQLSTVADGIERRRVPAGEAIVDQEQQSNTLFVLLAGQARVYIVGEREREVTLAMLRPGDHVGEMSLIDDGPHSATVRAETRCDLLVLGRAQFAQCLPKSPSLSYAILRGLSQRLRGANRQITSLALVDVYGRVARALLDMAESTPDGQLFIARRVSREKLAKVVGASREMTGRVLKHLERSGTIQTREDGSLLLKSSLPDTAENGRQDHATAE
jgi:CRP/FNR family transcriptional regulator, cyclic AMP receptor protein